MKSIFQNSTTAVEQGSQSYGWIVPAQAQTRIRIIFDDSGSMGGQKLEDAKIGCEEFLRACTLNQTAVAVHPMGGKALALTADLPKIAQKIHGIEIHSDTPMFQALAKAQVAEPKATRFILFSDGFPSDSGKEERILRAIADKTPIDTVLIWEGFGAPESSSEYQLLKEIADRTGGIFFVFDRKKVNFQDAFKYLAPAFRHALADGKFRLALQNGDVK
jgi:Mg-chelatase subunit ChlD